MGEQMKGTLKASKPSAGLLGRWTGESLSSADVLFWASSGIIHFNWCVFTEAITGDD